jgi:hypothetical protein
MKKFLIWGGIAAFIATLGYSYKSGISALQYQLYGVEPRLTLTASGKIPVVIRIAVINPTNWTYPVPSFNLGVAPAGIPLGMAINPVLQYIRPGYNILTATMYIDANQAALATTAIQSNTQIAFSGFITVGRFNVPVNFVA